MRGMTADQQLKLTDEELIAAYELITPIGLEELAYVYGRGAKKYAPNMWREQPIPIVKLYGRILGHLRRRVEGQIYDQDDGQMHMGSVAWSAFTIMHYDRGGA
mgnify:CR=1 FL=1